MGVLLLSDSEPVPDRLQGPYNRQRVRLLFFMNAAHELGVLALVAETILHFSFAMLSMKLAKAVCMERCSVGEALHSGVEETSVAVVVHRVGDSCQRAFSHHKLVCSRFLICFKNAIVTALPRIVSGLR